MLGFYTIGRGTKNTYAIKITGGGFELYRARMRCVHARIKCYISDVDYLSRSKTALGCVELFFTKSEHDKIRFLCGNNFLQIQGKATFWEKIKYFFRKKYCKIS